MDGPQTVDEYQRLISEVIKKQITLLGPQIALERARSVAGLTVSDDGTVTSISGAPREILQKVIDEYFVFSGLIVKKAMESLLQSYPGMAQAVPQNPAPPAEGDTT